MIARSLHWRLLGGAMAAILLALVLAWLFMTVLFEHHLERRLQAEMTRDGLRLVAGLVMAPGEAPRIERPPVDSRLETPAGGYYWQVTTAKGTLRSRSLWDGDLPQPSDAPLDSWHLRHTNGPYGKPVSLLERRVALVGEDAPALLQLAQDSAPLASARAEFGRELAAFLAGLWVVLSGAAWLQVRLGLRPLGRVRSELAALRDSASARLPEARLREVQPLIDSINALADTRERDLAVARQRAADLAHSLKTPLAAMAAQSRRARDAGADKAADGLDRAIAAIQRTVEAELARARIAAIRRQPGGSAAVRATVERLVTVLEQTDRGGELAFTLDIPANLQLAVLTDDLSEILGAVLENAVRYARRQVRVHAEAGPGWTRVAIEDDGPGIDIDLAKAALVRGGRLDEAQGGSGLGLAIARELAEATGGAIGMSRSTLGGLQVCFTWDASRKPG
jgi:signal transduction histidine kinase